MLSSKFPVLGFVCFSLCIYKDVHIRGFPSFIFFLVVGEEKSFLIMVLGSLRWVSLPEQGLGPGDLQRALMTLSHLRLHAWTR